MYCTFKNHFLVLLLFFLTIVVFQSAANAQSLGVVGKLYSKNTANQIYGKVTESITINSDVLKKAMDKSENV